MEGVDLVLAFVSFLVVWAGAAGKTSYGHGVYVACGADDVDVLVEILASVVSCTTDYDHALCLCTLKLCEECLWCFGSEWLKTFLFLLLPLFL